MEDRTLSHRHVRKPPSGARSLISCSVFLAARAKLVS
jgi:hypothetical protein